MPSSSSVIIPSLNKQAELLPTPSSSYCPTMTDPIKPLSLSSSSKVTGPKKYGSFLYQTFSDDTLSFDDAPPTPPHTTVSPNDDDEGLYLLWTHQLLREQGLRPASCRTNSYENDSPDNAEENDDDEDDDDESSQSESVTSMTSHRHSPYNAKISPCSSSSPLLQHQQRSLLSGPISFFSSFPFCSCPSS